MQKSLPELPIDKDPGLLVELGRLLARHLDHCSHQPVRGSRNLCTLEIRLAGNTDSADDVIPLLDEFLQRTLRGTDFVLKTNRHTWLTIVHCMPTDLPALMKRLQADWHRQAKARSLDHLPGLAFEPGVSLEATDNHADLSAVLVQYYS